MLRRSWMQTLNQAGRPTLRTVILRERWRASRLPSVPSALRGLDPRHALPIVWAFIGASGRRSYVLCPNVAGHDTVFHSMTRLTLGFKNRTHEV